MVQDERAKGGGALPQASNPEAKKKKLRGIRQTLSQTLKVESHFAIFCKTSPTQISAASSTGEGESSVKGRSKRPSPACFLPFLFSPFQPLLLLLPPSQPSHRRCPTLLYTLPALQRKLHLFLAPIDLPSLDRKIPRLPTLSSCEVASRKASVEDQKNSESLQVPPPLPSRTTKAD